MSFLQLVLSLDKTIRDLILFCRQCHSDPYRNTFLNMVSFECNPMYVKDVEDRSNTPKTVMLCMSKMSKMSKIDQIHLRAVMLCMSKMSKMGKEHTHTFWLITSLILNGFSIPKSFGKLRLRAFQPYHQILCMSKHVEDVEDRSNTPKGCNAMYVEDVEDGKRTYTHIFNIFDMLRHT